MIVSRTGYRISILGGGNDTPDFYSNYGSSIVGFGLNQHVYVMANFISRLDNVHYQAFYSHPEKVSQISEFKNPGIRGTLTFLERRFGILPPLSLYINNTLPSSCGIGSSSSLIVGILNAIYTLLGEKVSQEDLANQTNFIEREMLLEPGGRQDPWFVANSGIASLEITKNGDFLYNRFNLSKDFLDEFKSSSIIFYHSQRQSFDIARSYNKVDNEKYKLRLLDIGKAGKIAFQQENLIEIRKLLDENWNEKRRISNLISTEDIDNLYSTIRTFGASMKVCGVGGGGAVYVLCSPSKRDKIIDVVGLPTIPMDIDWEGSKILL